jgi:hypothetical protein
MISEGSNIIEESDIISNNEDTDSFMEREDSDLVDSTNNNSESNNNSNENNQLQEQENEEHTNKHNESQSNDSDLVESVGHKNDHFAKENNNNMTNFVELNPKLKKRGLKGLPILNNNNYAFTAELKEKNEIQRAIQTAHSNKIANELLKRKINVSIPERIESSFKKYRAKHGNTQDDFTSFLGYLKEASERAVIKYDLRKKMLTTGFIADKIRK